MFTPIQSWKQAEFGDPGGESTHALLGNSRCKAQKHLILRSPQICRKQTVTPSKHCKVLAYQVIFFFFKRSIHSSWRRLEDIRLFQPLCQFPGHKAAVNSVNVPGAAKVEGPSDREGRNLARAWLPVLCSLCLVKPMTRFWGHQRGQVTSVLRPPHKCPTPSLWTHSDLIPGVSQD